jgi:hypothetical protein
LKEKINDIGDERISICNDCVHHSDNKPNHKSNRPDKHCTLCGCTLSAKTKCLSCSCPIDKWSQVITKKEEETIDEQAGEI